MQNGKPEKDAILTGDGLKKERFLKKKIIESSIGIFFHAQAVNCWTCLLPLNMLNCLRIYGNGAHEKFRLCNIIYRVHKMF